MKKILGTIAQGAGFVLLILGAVFFGMSVPCQTPQKVEESGLWQKEVRPVLEVNFLDSWIHGKPEVSVELTEYGAWRNARIEITRKGATVKTIKARQIADYPNWKVVSIGE